jgi:hypothetical protein
MDAVRRQIATRFIENRDRPWNAVSEQLGFSGLSAFLRWFFEIASVAVCRLGVSPTLASTSGGKSARKAVSGLFAMPARNVFALGWFNLCIEDGAMEQH